MGVGSISQGFQANKGEGVTAWTGLGYRATAVEMAAWEALLLWRNDPPPSLTADT